MIMDNTENIDEETEEYTEADENAVIEAFEEEIPEEKPVEEKKPQKKKTEKVDKSEPKKKPQKGVPPPKPIQNEAKEKSIPSSKNPIEKSVKKLNESQDTKFSVTFKDAKIIKGIFETISTIITEVNINCDKDGLSISAMDLAHICLVTLRIQKEDCDAYLCETPFSMGVNLEDTTKIIKRLSSNDVLSFERNPKEQKLTIKMIPKGSTKGRKFSIALIHLEGEEINFEALTTMEYNTIVNMKLKYLDEAIKDAEIFSEIIQMKSGKNGLVFSTIGNIGDFETEIDRDLLDQVQQIADNEPNIYAITYLKNIIKSMQITDQCELKLTTERPLWLKLNFLQHSSLQYVLAPRVTEEDDPTDYDE